jgi:hypothetical protein
MLFAICMKLRQLVISYSFEGDSSPSKCKKGMTCLCTSTEWKPLQTNYVPSRWNITNEDVYMVLLMSLPPSFNNLITSLESMFTKDVNFQFIIARLFHEVSKKKECESFEIITLVNKIHKSNNKLSFYCKKLGYLWKIVWKKNDG